MGTGEPTGTARTTPKRERLLALEHRLTGRVVVPAAEDYDDVRALWNGMIDHRPAVIAQCVDTRDVVEAVTFAREHDLPLSVRGGGHNVAGTAVADGGLVVDLSGMNGVHVDTETRTASVAGGATIGDVDAATAENGLHAPLGVVSATGVAGLTLGGGLGHLRRQFGLSCDNLRAAEVVTADGEVYRASAHHHPDLFWALRGGGGNFGVVTEFEYALHPVEDVFALFVWYPTSMVGTVLRGVDEWARTAPREASVVPFFATVPTKEAFPVATHGQQAVFVFGGHTGDEATAERDFAGLRGLGEPLADLSGVMPFPEMQTLLDEDYPDGRRYYWKSVYLSGLDDGVIDLFERFGEAAPSPLSTLDLWQLGGAIDDVEATETAFWHRGKPYLLTFEANWEDSADDEANLAWARDGIAAARELPLAAGEYANFPGLLEDPARAVYGGNYERLARVKARYDPENRFRLNVNVSPAV